MSTSRGAPSASASASSAILSTERNKSPSRLRLGLKANWLVRALAERFPARRRQKREQSLESKNIPRYHGWMHWCAPKASIPRKCMRAYARGAGINEKIKPKSMAGHINIIIKLLISSTKCVARDHGYSCSCRDSASPARVSMELAIIDIIF